MRSLRGKIGRRQVGADKDKQTSKRLKRAGNNIFSRYLMRSLEGEESARS